MRKATKCRTDVVREWEGRKHRSQFTKCQVPSATFHNGGVSTVGKYLSTLLDYEDSQS